MYNVLFLYIKHIINFLHCKYTNFIFKFQIITDKFY
jgi:hypothetical protein